MVCDVVLHAASLVGAVLLDEGIETVLTTTDGNDLGALLNELVAKCQANAGSGTDKEDSLVSVNHCDCGSC